MDILLRKTSRRTTDWFFIAAGPATSSSSPWLVIAVSSVPMVPGNVMAFRIKNEGSEFSSLEQSMFCGKPKNTAGAGVLGENQSPGADEN